MFGIIVVFVLLSVLGVSGWYIARRLYKGFACFFSGIKFWPVLTIVFFFILLLLLGFMRSMLPFPEGIKDIFSRISGYSMGVLLYLLLFFLITDLLLLVPRLLKLSFTTHHLFNGFVTVGVLLLTAITCVYGFANARQIDKVYYEITLKGKQDISDMNVAVISDLHLGAIGSEGRLIEIVDELNRLEPEVVCIAGDFFDTDFTSIDNPEAAINTLRKLKATYGVYASLGNHDGGETYEQMIDFLKKANINLLSEEYTVIDERLIIVGRLDASPIGGYGNQKRKNLSEFFVRKDKTMPVIVLDHNPINIEEYSNEADVVLCGHTHKGQIFPANIITDLIYTVDYGCYRKDEQSPHVIVTSGVGYWGMPMRVGSDSEIVSLSFSSNK